MPVAPLALLFLLSWAELPFGVAQRTLSDSRGVKVGPCQETGWSESPLYRLLFTPPRLPEETYCTYVTPRTLDEVVRELQAGAPGSFEPQAVVAAEAFGQSGGYNRWKLARLYGATRARVARGPRMKQGQVMEAWTLISPYPDAALERLESGTLLIVLRLN